MLCPRVEEGVIDPGPAFFSTLLQISVGGVSLPVNGIAVPLNHLITKGPGGLHQQVVVGARRGSEQLGRVPVIFSTLSDAFSISSTIPARSSLVISLCRSEWLPISWPASPMALTDSGYLSHHCPHHKSGLYTSLIQNIQQLRDVGVVPSTVDPREMVFPSRSTRVDRQLPFGCTVACTPRKKFPPKNSTANITPIKASIRALSRGRSPKSA